MTSSSLYIAPAISFCRRPPCPGVFEWVLLVVISVYKDSKILKPHGHSKLPKFVGNWCGFYLREKKMLIIFPWCGLFFHDFSASISWFSQWAWRIFCFCAEHSQFGPSMEKNEVFLPRQAKLTVRSTKTKKFSRRTVKIKKFLQKNHGKTINIKEKLTFFSLR